MRGLRFLLVVAATAALLAVTGCGAVSSGGFTGPAGTPSPLGDAAFRARAQRAASAWAGSSAQRAWRTQYIPLADSVVLPTDAFHSTDDKLAFAEGHIRMAVRLPSLFAPSTVRWPDGTSLALPTVDAVAALRPGQPAVSCGADCSPALVITSVAPTTMRLPTSRGLATVPAWSVRIRGYDRPFTAAAVPGSPVPGTDPERAPSTGPNGADSVSLVSVSADGRTLTVRVEFGTCAEPGTYPTGAFHFEAKAAVVIEGWHQEPVQKGLCAGVGGLVEVPVRLDAPLGTRAVLDSSGVPLRLVGPLRR